MLNLIVIGGAVLLVLWAWLAWDTLEKAQQVDELSKTPLPPTPQQPSGSDDFPYWILFL